MASENEEIKAADKDITKEKEIEEAVEAEKEEEKKDIKVEENVEEKKEETTLETKKYNNYQKNLQKTKNNKVTVILIIIAVLIVLVGIFSTVFALANITNTKMMQGISINGIEVSGLTKEEASKKVEETINEQLAKDINMSYKEYSTTINPAQIEYSYKIENAIVEAYKTGRSGNIIQNNYEILKTLIRKKEINLEYTYNEELLKNSISDIETKLPDAMQQYSYYIENGNLIITPGKEGTTIQQDRLKTLILDSIQKEDKNITIPVQITKPEAIDIEKIHNEIYTEPKDAYYTTNPFMLYPHVEGVDFSISLDEAKQMLQEQKEEYVIKLNYTDPEITTNKIGTEAFPDLLSSFSTKYDVTNRNRSNNLKLASDKINGVVLMPGEEFSYNTVVGERTIAAGYKEAKIYSNGQVIDGLGGGICQISSTLYNSVLQANLEVTSRRNHQFVTSYVKAGLDATVVYGSTDFKFKNTRKYPIKIVSEVKNGVAKIDIYGIKEEVEYEVRLEPVVINYIPFTTKYIQDSSLESGQQVVDQKGSNGVKTVTYKYLFLNGNMVSKTTISTDTYNAMQKIVRVGP